MTKNQSVKEEKKFVINKASDKVPKIKLVNPALRPTVSAQENLNEGSKKISPRKSMESSDF